MWSLRQPTAPAWKKRTHIPSSSYLASLFPNSLSPEHLASFLWIPQTWDHYQIPVTENVVDDEMYFLAELMYNIYKDDDNHNK